MSSVLLLLILAALAFLYATVGHGGASGYLAVLALLGHSQDVMRPSALLMNLFVSAVSFQQFARAGHFRFRLFWPFALTSVPCAFIGAGIHLDPEMYKRVLGVCLLFAVMRLFGLIGGKHEGGSNVMLPMALLIGAVLGLVSGVVGIGGGILLSPILLLFGWANAKETAAVSALFIFVNSTSGLAGALNSGQELSGEVVAWVLAALVGGVIGGYLGSRKLSEPRLRHVLGAVLLLASIKLILP